MLSALLSFGVLPALAQHLGTQTSAYEGNVYHTGGSLGIGTASPDSSALLDIVSNSKGVLIPRMTTAEILALPNPANGLLVFNADIARFVFFDARLGQWQNLFASQTCNAEFLWDRGETRNGRSAENITVLANPADKVGIGTADPQSKLDVAGDMLISKRTAGADASLKFADYAGLSVGFAAPDTVLQTVTWKLPPADGTPEQVLTTDGSGNLTWLNTPGSQWTDLPDLKTTALRYTDYKLSVGLPANRAAERTLHLQSNISESTANTAAMRLENVNNNRRYAWDVENAPDNALTFRYAGGTQSSEFATKFSLGTQGELRMFDTDAQSSAALKTDNGKLSLKYTTEQTDRTVLSYTSGGALSFQNNTVQIDSAGTLDARRFETPSGKFSADNAGHVRSRTLTADTKLTLTDADSLSQVLLNRTDTRVNLNYITPDGTDRLLNYTDNKKLELYNGKLRIDSTGTVSAKALETRSGKFTVNTAGNVTATSFATDSFSVNRGGVLYANKIVAKEYEGIRNDLWRKVDNNDESKGIYFIPTSGTGQAQVGIGTNNMLNSALHIKQHNPTRFTTLTLSNHKYYITNPQQDYGTTIQFLGDNNLPNRNMQLQTVFGPESRPDRFSVVFNDDGTLKTAFTVKSTGNVGIGTTTPGANLEVAGSSMILKDNDGKQIRFLTNNPGVEIGSSTGLITFFHTGVDYNKLICGDIDVVGDANLTDNGVNADLSYKIDGKAALTVFNTVNPDYDDKDELVINRDWRNSDFVSDFKKILIYGNTQIIDIGTTTPDAMLSIQKNVTTGIGISYNDMLNLKTKTAGEDYADWKIQSRGDNLRFYQTGDFDAGKGNISTPVLTMNYAGIIVSNRIIVKTVNRTTGVEGAELLEINEDHLKYTNNFKVKSDGFVYARDITVTNLNPLPDYVFANDYKLRTLPELEQYITENKHLPGMPTAAHVAENGMQLGELNRILLEKVEELTLYIIEQNKKIEALQSEVETLKTK